MINLWKKFSFAFAAVTLAGSVLSQTKFPDKPVRIIVPYPAGISPDVVARLLAEKLSRLWGQPVIIDNRPGASGMIGAEAAAKSPGDGYTLLIAVTAIMSMNPHLYEKLPYDPLRDFKFVTHILNVPFVLTAAISTPYNSVGELLEEARKNPGKINYATLGPGSHSHTAMEWLMNLTKTRMTQIPYKGSPLTEMMGGQVSLYLDPIVTSQALIAGQKVKALGVSSGKRSPVLPNVPSISESIPGFETYAFQGIYVPKDTPAEIVEKLNSDLVKVIRMPEIQKKLQEFGYLPIGSTSDEFEKMARQDYDFWGKLIKEYNIKLE